MADRPSGRIKVKLPVNTFKDSPVTKEFEDPSLLRDVGLWLNFQQLFSFREWDFVPDVMVYTTRYQVGYPNGRYLTDDVAALLAQHGDTLLLELSHNKGQWPRHTTNDKEFSNPSAESQGVVSAQPFGFSFGGLGGGGHKR